MSVFEEDYEKNLKKWKEQKDKYKNQSQIKDHFNIDIKKEKNNELDKNYKPLPTIKRISLNKKIKIIIFLIPIFIFLYIIYNNVIASHEFIYKYDIGNDNYLSPGQRISQEMNNGVENYREIKQNLVYFSVPIARGSERVIIDVRFKDNFPKNSIFSIGGKDENVWHYKWKTIYNPVLVDLGEFGIENGLYRINNELGDYTEEELTQNSGFVIATNKKIKNIPVVGEDYIGETIINYTLRGGHEFYFFGGNNISLEVKKQDLNWYNGSDELEISILDSEENLIGNLTIEDDGIIDVNKDKGVIKEGELKIFNIPQGVYKIEFGDFDGLIREIKINTKKIVAKERVYLADSSIFNLDEKEEIIYTSFFRDGDISFKTWHDKAFQTAYVNGETVEIEQRSNESIYQAEMGLNEIKTIVNDLIISTPGYFSFTKESYFEPFENRIFNIKNDKKWIKENIDYLILDYKAPRSDGEWLISETQFDIKDLYVKDNKLNFVFNIPHLSQDLTVNNTIPIDWINIKVIKPGIFDK